MMQRGLTKVDHSMPMELKVLLRKVPLVGNEKIKDYEAFFFSFVDTIEPKDPVEWMFTFDFVYLCWQIRRERAVEVAILEEAEKEVVCELLKEVQESPGSLDNDAFRIFGAANEAQLWASDRTARKETAARLAAKGYGPDVILAKAHQKAAREIDACEKRIEGYERRRAAILRDLGYWRGAFAKKLDAAAEEIIDAEFTVAA